MWRASRLVFLKKHRPTIKHLHAPCYKKNYKKKKKLLKKTTRAVKNHSPCYTKYNLPIWYVFPCFQSALAHTHTQTHTQTHTHTNTHTYTHTLTLTLTHVAIFTTFRYRSQCGARAIWWDCQDTGPTAVQWGPVLPAVLLALIHDGNIQWGGQYSFCMGWVLRLLETFNTINDVNYEILIWFDKHGLLFWKCWIRGRMAQKSLNHLKTPPFRFKCCRLSKKARYDPIFYTTMLNIRIPYDAKKYIFPTHPCML